VLGVGRKVVDREVCWAIIKVKDLQIAGERCWCGVAIVLVAR